MSAIDLNRQGFLPAQISSEILAKAQTDSAIMRLARKIALPGTGVSIPVITSDPEASWVGETEKKPVSTGEITPKLMSAYKLAVILPVSKELTRDAAALYDELKVRLPFALAKKFDETVIGAVSAPGSNFDNFASATVSALDGDAYDGLVSAYTNIAPHGRMNGVALGSLGVATLLAAKDKSGRPLFIANAGEGEIPALFGAKTVVGDGIDGSVLGVAGDWTQAVYGTVEGIKVDVSEEATLDLGGGKTINLWQQNMVAVRAEMECGFRCNLNAFSILKNAE